MTLLRQNIFFIKIFSTLFILVNLFNITSCETSENVIAIDSLQNGNLVFYDNSQNKLWAHRANTIEELQTFTQEFAGVEFDVVFAEGTTFFDIRHDVADPVSNIDLVTYFGSLEKPNKFYYWIDFKNLNQNNVQNALDRLNYVLTKFDLYDNVIVESWDYLALSVLAEAGIFTCFWIPHFEYTVEDLQNPQNEQYLYISNILKMNKFNAISAHYTMLDFMKTFFPETPLHIWTNGLYTEEDKLIIEEMANTPNLKVILVDYPENFLVP